eukprot:10348253-Ditylum_brightwellii.AAC.1
MERSKQIKCVDGDKDDGVVDSVNDSNDGGDKHFTHLSLAVDRHLTERNKQDTFVVCGNKDN